jgi:predicted nuclease of predicted toxin-antitoxin system
VRLLVDESVDRQIVDLLRLQGHRVRYAAEMDPGIPDEAVLDLANKEADVLVTADKDFGELVFRQGRLTSGILLVRLAGLSPASKAELAASTIDQYGEELPGAFAVLTSRSFRVRKLQ